MKHLKMVILRPPIVSIARNVPGPYSHIPALFLSLPAHQLDDGFRRGTAVLKSKDLCDKHLPLSSTVPDGNQSIHKPLDFFCDNIPHQLKTLTNLRKLTRGQTPRVFLSCVSGAFVKGVLSICRCTDCL